MNIHDIHGAQVSIHDNAKETKDFLREQDKHVVEGYLKDAEKHGKAHFEDSTGKKFTMEHKKDGEYHVRPRNI